MYASICLQRGKEVDSKGEGFSSCCFLVDRPVLVQTSEDSKQINEETEIDSNT